jgi:uncharacterized membrane protein YuzA (DUF378 family)
VNLSLHAAVYCGTGDDADFHYADRTHALPRESIRIVGNACKTGSFSGIHHLIRRLIMATMNPYIPERRQAMDRRHNVASASTMGANRATTSERSDMRAAQDAHAAHDTHAMSAFDWIAMTLLIIGGLNWGAVGLFGLDVVANIFGEGTAISRVIYILVGLSALYSIYTASKMSRTHK